MLDVQLAAIEVAAVSNSSSSCRAAQETGDGRDILQSAGAFQQLMSSASVADARSADTKLPDFDAEHDADPWDALVDSDSQSSPRAVAGSPPCHTPSMLSSQSLHALQQPFQASAGGQQPEQAATLSELTTQLSPKDTAQCQRVLSFKNHRRAGHAEPGGQQHSAGRHHEHAVHAEPGPQQYNAGSGRLSWELTEQQQPMTTGQQLQRQLQQSQQHLLQCQQNHKHRIAAAFGQAVKPEAADLLPVQRQAANPLRFDCHTFTDCGKAEPQAQQEKQHAVEASKQAQHAQRGHMAERRRPEQAPVRTRAETSRSSCCSPRAKRGDLHQRADMHAGKLQDLTLDACHS